MEKLTPQTIKKGLKAPGPLAGQNPAHADKMLRAMKRNRNPLK